MAKQNIQDRIIRKQVEFFTATGKEAGRVYLGRDDMHELLKWTEDNDYISELDNIEGRNRPEVCGLPCFVVNEDRHLECS